MQTFFVVTTYAQKISFYSLVKKIEYFHFSHSKNGKIGRYEQLVLVQVLLAQISEIFTVLFETSVFKNQ